MDALATAINDALARCNGVSGGYKLPDDYDCFPLLVVDPVSGKCTSINGWRARIGDHVSDGSSPELATYGICRGPVTP